MEEEEDPDDEFYYGNGNGDGNNDDNQWFMAAPSDEQELSEVGRVVINLNPFSFYISIIIT